jgi:hypothetical protein
MQSSTAPFWMMNFNNPLIIITNPLLTPLSSKTTTPSTGANGLKSGLQTMGTLL